MTVHIHNKQVFKSFYKAQMEDLASPSLEVNLNGIIQGRYLLIEKFLHLAIENGCSEAERDEILVVINSVLSGSIDIAWDINENDWERVDDSQN